MSKLEELIQELCPDGVEYHEFKDKNLFKFYYGKGNKIPEDIGGKYDVYGANGVVSHIDEYNCEDVSIIGHIGAVGMVNRCKGKCFVTYNGTIAEVVDKSKLDSQYLYYLLTTLNLSSYKKGSQPFLSVSDFQKIKVPVPPLEVQCEIVRILDKFTLLTAELTAELTARRKQYNYYTHKLFKDLEEEFIELDKIGEVTKLAGFEFSQYVKYSNEGNIIALRGLNVKSGRLILNDVKYIDSSDLSKLDRSKLYENDILYTYVGTVGQVGLIDKNDKYYLAPNVARIRIIDNKVLPKYVMYYLLTDEFKKKQLNVLTGTSSMKNITMSNIRKFKIPVISIEKQRKIIDILDRFDKLCNDITSGLPAEIELNNKRYEYYRDKLLTFKEKNNE